MSAGLIVSNKFENFISHNENWGIKNQKNSIFAGSKFFFSGVNNIKLSKKLPKNKTIVFNCTAGGRSIEAWTKLNEAKFDVSEIFYFDANIDCIANECKIEANEPLD